MQALKASKRDNEMLSSFAPLSELAFEMEMEGAEPFVPELALPQRRLSTADASSPLSPAGSPHASSRLHPRAVCAPSAVFTPSLGLLVPGARPAGEARGSASQLAQRGQSPGRTPMYQLTMMCALHPRNERERHARSLR
ncbi:hypothetical protein T484DRAFT_1764397 [Baffinella frigidus]|nr:hypothetical protein T484DRAFT_1764397 [Cryptophyta sp. CCMP2293]